MRNPASLDRLVSDHLPAVLLFATRLSGNTDAAEELVQDALLRAVRSWKTFRGQSEFRTWLFRIVINVFRDRLRASPTAPVTIDDYETEMSAATTATPVEVVIQAELEALVAREVSLLPPRQREVLVLVVYEKLSTRQVAAMVGIGEANVYSTLSAARVRLKKRLARYLGSVEK